MGTPTNTLDTTLTNGRFELPASARGVLVLADPPEAGWRMPTRSNQEATADAELFAAPGDRCSGERACHTRLFEDGEQR